MKFLLDGWEITISAFMLSLLEWLVAKNRRLKKYPKVILGKRITISSLKVNSVTGISIKNNTLPAIADGG